MRPAVCMVRLSLLLLLGGASGAGAQLRVVDYNTAGDARSGLSTLFAAIGAESVNGIAKAPDVITLQEQDSSASTTQAIVNLLNSIYGAGTYARATLDGATSGGGRPGMIYNTTSVSLIAQSAVGTVNTSSAARQTLRYQLRPLGYDAAADFYVYSSHYKASNTSGDRARRNVEAQAIRANADALGQGAHIIYAGDFNIYTSSEPMWATLTGGGNGQAFDPINRVGSWSNNSSFRDVHTQSPVTTARYGGQITGGMDDRFDFQLVTGEFLDSEGLSYIAGSYHAFGNTGTHAFNGEIISGSASALAARLPGYSTAEAQAVLTALTTSSDHLPVVADYQLPARMQVTVQGAPTRVIVGAAAKVDFSVGNSASVVAANGADELDYAFSAQGGLVGAGAGVDDALGGANAHSVNVQTTVAGHQTGKLTVTSDSQAVANGSFEQTFDYDVLDHASAAILSAEGGITGERFFDLTQSGSITLSLANLSGMVGFTAGLDLDDVVASGDFGMFLFTLGVFENLAAGQDVDFQIAFSGFDPGYYEATYELRLSDEDLPGASTLDSITLTFGAHVIPEPSALFLLGMTLVLLPPFLARRRRTTP